VQAAEAQHRQEHMHAQAPLSSSALDMNSQACAQKYINVQRLSYHLHPASCQLLHAL
jgi:hypothetical protein